MALLDDLQRLQYGAGLAENLARIGRAVGEGKRQADADALVKKMMGDISIEDPTSFMKPSVTEAMSQLQQTPEGQRSIAGVQMAQQFAQTVEQAAQRREQLVLSRISNLRKPYEDAYGEYLALLKTPGVTEEKLAAHRTILEQMRKNLLPQFKGYESQLPEPPPPTPMRQEVTFGTHFVGKGRDGKFYTFIPKFQGGQILGYEQGPEAKDTGGGAIDMTEVDNLVDPRFWSTTGDEALQYVKSPMIRNNVMKMARGELTPRTVTSLMARNQSFRQFYPAAAAQVNPSWSEADYAQLHDAVIRFTKGKGADNLISLNQAVDHTGNALKQLQGIKNYDVKMWNRIVNVGRNETSDPRINNLKLTFQLVVDELARAFGGKAGTIPELATLMDRFDTANSTAALSSVINKAFELLSDRFNAESQQWTKTTHRPITGPNGLNPLDPQGRMTLIKAGREDIVKKIDEGQEVAGSARIRVKRKSDGKVGNIPENQFDPSKYERVEDAGR